MKKNPKKIRVSFILTQYAMLQAGLTSVEVIKQQFEFAGMFLYEKEAEKLIAEKQEAEEDFDAEDFLTFLVETNALKKGGRTPSGEGRGTTIDSVERAEQVANNPEDVETIVEIMKAVLKLRDELKPLISDHAELSVALKNKKVKSEAPEESAEPEA